MLAGVGILGIAFGFASQDIAANFMSGILLHFIHPFRIDDFIKSGEFLGHVEAIDMRSTKIRNQQGQRITIPNKNILGNPIINYTISGERRVDLPWSLTQVEDLPKAEELAVKAVEALEWRIPDHPVELFYEKVGDYTIDFEIRFWTDPEQKVYLKARSEAIKAIKQTFEEHGIPMPSPVRVLDFGIVGGTSLREQLQGVALSLSGPGVQSAGKEKDRGKRKKSARKPRKKNGGKPSQSPRPHRAQSVLVGLFALLFTRRLFLTYDQDRHWWLTWLALAIPRVNLVLVRTKNIL